MKEDHPKRETFTKKGKIKNPSAYRRDLWQDPATVGIVQREAKAEEPPAEASGGRKIPRKKLKKLRAQQNVKSQLCIIYHPYLYLVNVISKRKLKE